MDTHKNPNLDQETTTIFYHHQPSSSSSSSSQDFKKPHFQQMNLVSEKINNEEEKEEGFIIKKPNSLSSSSSSSSSQDFKKTHFQHMNLVSEKINGEEGFAVEKPNSLSCCSSLALAGGGEGETMTTPPPLPSSMPEKMVVDQESGRERLKRHRVEMAGRVWIPDIWGHEDLLKDWIDCSVFDSSLGNNTIMSARAALVQEGRSTLRIENRC